jgi:hypothetical protein
MSVTELPESPAISPDDAEEDPVLLEPPPWDLPAEKRPIPNARGTTSPQHLRPKAPQADDEPETVRKQAYLLQNEAAALYLGGSHGSLFQGQMRPLAFNAYVHQLLHDAGDPKDPIERMLVEQLILAHHNIGRFHVLSADAQGVTEACLYQAAVARLLGEFRKTAMALKSYRLSGAALSSAAQPNCPATPQPSATSADIPEQGRADTRASRNGHQRGVNGNGNGHHAADGFTQSQTGSGREEELAQAARAQR